MKINNILKFTLTKATILSFIFIPLLGLILRNYDPRNFQYGYGDVSLNSVFFLSFAIYTIILAGFHFYKCANNWQIDNKRWKPYLFFTYMYVFIIASSLPLLAIGLAFNFTKRAMPVFYDFCGYLFVIGVIIFFLVFTFIKFTKKHSLYTTIPSSIIGTLMILGLILLYINISAQSDELGIAIWIFAGAFLFPIGLFLLYLNFKELYFIKSKPLPYFFILFFTIVSFIVVYTRCFSPILILPSGIISLCLAIGGIKQLKGKPKSFIVINFVMCLIFLLIGAFPAVLILLWWIQGGMRL